MVKLERTLSGSFNEILQRIERGILSGSVSATLEASSNMYDSGSRCSVFERYSYMGGNRLSLTVVLYQGESGAIRLTAVTSGGSQAVFFKMNRFGEDAFLEKLAALL